MWIRDAKKLKVQSDIIESSLSELPSCLNCIEDVIDTFLVKTELRWGLKLLIKMTMMHPLISFSSLQDKTVLSLEVSKLKRAAAKVQRFENFEEDLDDEYRKSFYIDTGRNPLTK